ncbi:MAG: acetyl/propionyl/methylcrotonyl-CoA carboxylase subunit alpha [Rhodobacter sp.]|uniref:acetyl/propionyl/methylcrotonyl-CoA carboxylase subunit alpha n=1 Tax=Pararhodobacter sp. TaxID=2127056 RepID=UPI002C49E2CF|nr:acetyl/propionyl/methylcrotonyl-CoA carboxylase subunit alpha [Pararhodobacter sp.]MCC0073930.1 acetyl/propionyl/methylcrotonyl-CoA carboxylase subunit alpha [Rhodobacter sp.]HPD93055.1 acetyl/propionyl/methylcrotonyl-CoA carboxylase subunit alpha [Pararhodobacter sp.]
MFDTILIANRGEIACRVIRTARAMGLRTVAVYSDADAESLHVALADEAVRIGGPRPADSYLRADRILAAAHETGAQAIHPGYGFLSENPDFVEAVEAAGLVFIGPSAAAIRAMGLKDAAKALMDKAGVPVVPGYMGANQDPAHLQVQADAIGYPVLIKAVAGGGGKGMRLVERAADFADALTSAQGEAATAFGNAAVLIEKYIQQPRHIEVQVFGDGNRAVHLFERDCSLQRRHQKVIEEAPAPGMTAEMRAAMGEAAVRAAEAIGYKGAGTVEFIVDGSNGLRPDGFWFMEMNTRLQVEHPVTEEITGVDLVEWQIRVAAGESLPARQKDLTITGHAFEARLYAEDVPAGFLPATGTLDHLWFPEGARIESGVRQGDTISPWYDPMIAKIVAHGPTRAVALARLSAALAATQVAGSVTNLDFLGALTRHAGFAAGQVDTGLIGRDLAALIAPPALRAETVALAALTALGAAPGQGFTQWTPLWQAVTLETGDTTCRCAVARTGAGWTVRVDDTQLTAEHRGGQWWIAGRRAPGVALRRGDRVSVFGATTVHFTQPDPLLRDLDHGAGAGVVLAPMPGLVKAVFVAPGAAVEKGARLAILEAMKMEHTLTAGRDGTVAEVLAQPGQQVEAGAALIALAEE